MTCDVEKENTKYRKIVFEVDSWVFAHGDLREKDLENKEITQLFTTEKINSYL